MQKYDAIESGIERKDVKALREAIGSICYTSRNFSSGEFDEVIRYVESKGIVLKDEQLIGNPTISSQKSNFTDEDFAKAIFELKRNFCDARIEDVKTIGRSLYSKQVRVEIETAKSVARTEANKSTGGTSPNFQSHQKEKGNKMLWVGLVLVALIVAIIIVQVIK